MDIKFSRFVKLWGHTSTSRLVILPSPFTCQEMQCIPAYVSIVLSIKKVVLPQVHYLTANFPPNNNWLPKLVFSTDTLCTSTWRQELNKDKKGRIIILIYYSFELVVLYEILSCNLSENPNSKMTQWKNSHYSHKKYSVLCYNFIPIWCTVPIRRNFGD